MLISPIDVDLILGWDWTWSHDQRLLYDNFRIDLYGPAHLQLDILIAGTRPMARTLSVIGHEEFRRLLHQIEWWPLLSQPRRQKHVLRYRVVVLTTPHRSPRWSRPVHADHAELAALDAANSRSVLGVARVAHLNLTATGLLQTARRCLWTARNSTSHPFAWQTRSCASGAPTTRHSLC